jgi:hypothetical protein
MGVITDIEEALAHMPTCVWHRAVGLIDDGWDLVWYNPNGYLGELAMFESGKSIAMVTSRGEVTKY